jgi:hypothetical protein
VESDEVQIAVAVKSCVLLSLYVPVAVNCCVLPAATDAFAGLTAIEISVPPVVVTVKYTPLLVTPFTVTMTLPEVAPLGTGATNEVLLQFVAVAVAPLKVTVLVPCVEPKFVPVIVTPVPIGPEDGERLLIFGVGRTVNDTPLLGWPFTVMTTFPVLAAVGTVATIDVVPQLVIVVAVVPLKVTVLAPCVVPKFAPVIVTEAPTAPEVGDTLDMLGVGTTVNATLLLSTPLA